MGRAVGGGCLTVGGLTVLVWVGIGVLASDRHDLDNAFTWAFAWDKAIWVVVTVAGAFALGVWHERERQRQVRKRENYEAVQREFWARDEREDG